jgi:hypothetical protein
VLAASIDKSKNVTDVDIMMFIARVVSETKVEEVESKQKLPSHLYKIEVFA